MSETTTETTTTETTTDEATEGSEKLFTQADLDSKIGERMKREREQTAKKFADYDELKKAAEGRKSAEDRLAELETKYAAAEVRALRAQIANEHGISTEDRDLFLTGSDEESLQAQAKRLAEREFERKKRGNTVRREGQTSQPPADDERETARRLFGGGD